MSADRFRKRFEEQLGAVRVTTILRGLSDRPVVLLAGDPGVGKSAVARRLAAAMGCVAGGSGTCVRAAAVARGLSLEEFNAVLSTHPEEDVAVDAKAAEVIAQGKVEVFESRLAGHLGRWLRESGRSGLLAVYLHCDPAQQALRLVQREGGPALRDHAASVLLGEPGLTNLVECVSALRRCTADDRALSAASIVEAQALRTAADRDRMRRRYGVELDDASAYDHVFDTTTWSVDECVALLLRLVKASSA